MGRQITVALYHRDSFSHGIHRQHLGYEAYHWGIIVMHDTSQGGECDAYEATDASELDQATWRLTNPNMEWWLRVRSEADDAAIKSKLLGRIIIGAVSDDVSRADLKELFERVPLPVKNTHPQQSCVSWLVDSVTALQEKGWASSFSVDQFKDWALTYADGRLAEDDSREAIETYSNLQE